jgi:hypothetical protein
MMQRHGLRLLFLVAAIAAVPGLCAAAPEEQSLLTADGSLHVVRSGRAVDLGVQDAAVSPEHNVIEWTSRAQDGTLLTAIVPSTDSQTGKRGLQLAFDEQTQALLLLWTEDISAYSQIRVGVLYNGTWTNTGLLPNQGLSAAYNPQMLVTHKTATYLDEHDNVVTKTNSILSVVWWEDAQYGQARYATLFLDEDGFDPANLAIYDLPVLLGGGGETLYRGVPSGAYLFPSLQNDGLSDAILASFADLHDQRQKVVRITFPSDQGKPSETGNLKWERRHIPIVGVMTQGPVARMTPILALNAAPELWVKTSIGAGYRPTLYWRDGNTLKYTRLGDHDWSAVRSVSIDDSMPYEKALSLVAGMAQRN